MATVELVRDMVEAGSAQCVMGNHDFNAIACDSGSGASGQVFAGSPEAGGQASPSRSAAISGGSPREAMKRKASSARPCPCSPRIIWSWRSILRDRKPGPRTSTRSG
jgi:hypothetical protein